MMYQHFKNNGWNVTALQWIGRRGEHGNDRHDWGTKYCDKVDWNKNEILGYDAKALNQTCQEITQSSSWTLMEYL